MKDIRGPWSILYLASRSKIDEQASEQRGSNSGGTENRLYADDQSMLQYIQSERAPMLALCLASMMNRQISCKIGGHHGRPQ